MSILHQRKPIRVLLTIIGVLGGILNSFAQLPTITVQFANPEINCNTSQYCLDVEFQSNTANQEVFGMNVRFFYDDSILELVGFSNFQGGYGPVAPNPPTKSTSGPAGPALFNFAGAAEFINGAIQLVNINAPDIILTTTGWTKLFKMCFLIDSTFPTIENFCPPVVWDLEQIPANGGFLAGDDGVVITVVDPDPNIESSPSLENVVQFNWEYIGGGSPPYGQFSEDSCINVNCSLPVVMLSFTGYNDDSGNHLEWQTVAEVNNLGFDVERSPDGIQWEKLSFVNGGETIQAKQNYRFNDLHPFRGRNIYRLKQIDNDGRFQFSSIVILEADRSKESLSFDIYPNPASEGILTINLTEEVNANSTLSFYSPAGQLLREEKLIDRTFHLNITNMPSGVYLICISNGNQKLYKNVVIE